MKKSFVLTGLVVALSACAEPMFECSDAGLTRVWRESVRRHRAGEDAADSIRRLREGRWLDDVATLKADAAAAIRSAKPGTGVIRAIGGVVRATGDRTVIAPLLDDCERHFRASAAVATNVMLLNEAVDLYQYNHLLGRKDQSEEQFGLARSVARQIGVDLRLPEPADDPSCVCDSIVTSLVGLRPYEGAGLVVRPQAPDGWDWFRLSGVSYHGKPLEIVWDRTGAKFGKGKGLVATWGGETVLRQDELRPRRPLAGYSDCCKTDDADDFFLFRTVLTKAGYDVKFIPYLADTNAIRAAVADLDVMVVVGGHDINPARWGDALKPWSGKPNLARDDYDWALVTAVTNRGIPMAGICRGEQLMNVFFGGSLYQDIEAEFDRPGEPCPPHLRDGQGIWDADDANAPEKSHDLLVERGSWLHRLVGKERIRVNSYHHQAAKRIAPNWRVTGRAPDGTVEFLECRDYPAVAAQFHPECLGAHADSPDLNGETWIRFFAALKDIRVSDGRLLAK